MTSITKVVFLDFDGPMIPLRAWCLTDSMLSDCFDAVAVACILRLLTKNPGIALVISSSWRALGKEKIEVILDKNGISPKYLHEDWETKNLENHLMLNRHREILEWVERHPEITNYIALDDFPLKLPEKHFVHVTSNDGLLWEHQRKIFRLLEAKGFGV